MLILQEEIICAISAMRIYKVKKLLGYKSLGTVMKKKSKEEKSVVQNRKHFLIGFSVSLFAILIGVAILQISVYRDNNVPFVLEVENTPIEELNHSIAVYINNTPEWISVERGKNYEVGAQYDGIIENHTGKKIKDWKLAVYLPRKGVLDSYWNGNFQVVNDRIEIMPMDYNREIEDGKDLPFGFVLYSGELLSFEHFWITGYYDTQMTNYPLFWILVVLFTAWLILLCIYIGVYFRLRKLERAAQKDREIIRQAMETFAHLVDAKDQYTQEHSIRVALYSEEIARRMGKSEEEVKLIKYIALVHDCGKIGVPDAVLNKNGALNGGEKEIINSHTVLGGNVLHHFTAIEGIRDGALYHHERYDGTGYPQGLAGEKIPLCARIICIADAYDAMSSDRCYRRHLQKEVILEELIDNSGKQFDPELVRYMIDMIEDGFVYRIHHYDEDDNEINNLGNVLEEVSKSKKRK